MGLISTPFYPKPFKTLYMRLISLFLLVIFVSCQKDEITPITPEPIIEKPFEIGDTVHIKPFIDIKTNQWVIPRTHPLIGIICEKNGMEQHLFYQRDKPLGTVCWCGNWSIKFYIGRKTNNISKPI